jgi:hypothetical protein
MPGAIHELDDHRVVEAWSAPFRAVDAARSPDAVVSLMTAARPSDHPCVTRTVGSIRGCWPATTTYLQYSNDTEPWSPADAPTALPRPALVLTTVPCQVEYTASSLWRSLPSVCCAPVLGGC